MPEIRYEHITTSPTDKSQLEISGEIPVQAVMHARSKALKEIGNSVSIPGFRPGHIPEKVLIERVGELAVLEEAAEIILKEIAPELIEQHAPRFIGRPAITITKLAPGNPVGFKILISVMPEVTLPDYKTIAQKEMATQEAVQEVTDKDIEDVILEVRKQRAHQEFHKANTDQTHHNHNDADIATHMPELTDEFVKSLGNFENIADFKAKAKENLIKEKEFRAKEKKRIKLLEKLIEETKVVLPQILIDNELARMFSQFEGDISGMGLKVEDYLKHIKKTPDDLRKEWLPDAEKRAKLNLILDTIAEKEKITVDPELLEHESKHLLEQYKDADPLVVKSYVLTTLTREKAIIFLEEQK